MSEPEDDLGDSIAGHAAAIVAGLGQVSDRLAMTQSDRDGFAEIAAEIIEMTAAIVSLIRNGDAFWSDPAMVETTIRDRMPPDQVAQLAARLAS